MAKNDNVSRIVSLHVSAADREIISVPKGNRNRKQRSSGLYLVRSGNIYLFQIRIPKRLSSRSKSTLVRISLGPLAHKDARETADALAALARQCFREIEKRMTDNGAQDLLNPLGLGHEGPAGDDWPSELISMFLKGALSVQPTFDAFASGLIFMGASYCYGSGLLSHFRVPMQTTQRLTFVVLYTLVLTYLVFVEKSLISQLFLTDMAFAFLLGWAILRVRRQASSGIDKALVVTSCIVVLDSVSRATYFTFFTGSSNDFADFADSAYNLAVHLTTITVCMFFPFSALAAVGHTALERYRRAAETDELTGLLNRRGFRHAVERGDNAARHGSLIICDIDHFKGINDGYGHGFGDEVIRGLGEDLLQVIGPHGCTARYGGEEFVAFLPGVDVIKARDLAQSLRRAFAERAWVAFDVSARFTVSCGVASLRAEDTRLEAAVERADRALYAAKAAGRNRVFVDTADVQTPLHLATGNSAGERMEA